MKRALVLSGGGARGSFQIGVWKYLVELGWKPDIICGSSVGAINAAAIGSGMDIKTLIHLWTTYNRRKMYSFNLLQFFAYLFSKKNVKPLLDIAPLKKMIVENLDFNALKQSPIDTIVTAVNLLTGHLEYFTQNEIKLEHILASSAMPLLFPWQQINGEPYWDGGVMANTPIAPAIDSGADEIIVVLLSIVSHKKQSAPENFLTASEHLFEHFLAGSYQANLMNYGFKENRNCDLVSKKKINLLTLAPSKMLGFKSLLSFSKTQARKLIEEGYNTAKVQLKDNLINIKE